MRRLSKTLTAAAVLLTLASLTACGGDGDTGGLDGIGGIGGTDGKASPPKAKDVASMVRFVNEHAVCKDLETEASAGGAARKSFAKLPEGTAGGVKERAFCEADRGEPIVLLVVSDMKKFTQGLKAKKAAGEDGVALVGANFAVVPDDGDTARALTTAGMLLASCDAEFNSKIPSGFTKSKGAVEGCVLTDFFPV
ncbi:hypothetical protein AB0D46_28525 [Streptomyces sp. NPDC048383]|uniref:hypothetical protein n=1 Tax=Streptomyces sp. NPDC048383 TaxID=3155386 RepID=UPI0034271644